ncbi:hypothetical protein EDB84DRAFT_851071 [Lactarius hengduanensis]|nr:hypothetical protein EDB84DRAFT_851071 [Lactarius hengduanensis]
MTTPHDSRDLEARTEAQRWFSNQTTVYGNEGNTQARKKRQGEAEDTEYGDSSARYWNVYASETEISDQKLIETLTGDTNTLLFLNSIFSAIIAAFIIEMYKALQPDNNQETVCLLSQLVSQENSSQQPSRFCPSPYPGGPSEAVIRSNILLVLSFFLAMMSALACTLIQLWCREYTKYATLRVAPQDRGRVRTYLFQGLERFDMRRFISVTGCYSSLVALYGGACGAFQKGFGHGAKTSISAKTFFLWKRRESKPCTSIPMSSTGSSRTLTSAIPIWTQF